MFDIEYDYIFQMFLWIHKYYVGSDFIIVLTINVRPIMTVESIAAGLSTVICV